jgi:hypothetical protein
MYSERASRIQLYHLPWSRGINANSSKQRTAYIKKCAVSGNIRRSRTEQVIIRIDDDDDYRLTHDLGGSEQHLPPARRIVAASSDYHLCARRVWHEIVV